MSLVGYHRRQRIIEEKRVEKKNTLNKLLPQGKKEEKNKSKINKF